MVALRAGTHRMQHSAHPDPLLNAQLFVCWQVRAGGRGGGSTRIHHTAIFASPLCLWQGGCKATTLAILDMYCSGQEPLLAVAPDISDARLFTCLSVCMVVLHTISTCGSDSTYLFPFQSNRNKMLAWGRRDGGRACRGGLISRVPYG